MFLGIPLPLIGFACFILAAVFIFVKPTANPEHGFWANYALRWFHPLAWVLFGTAAIYQRSSNLLAVILIAAGIAAYAFFIKNWVSQRTKK